MILNKEDIDVDILIGIIKEDNEYFKCLNDFSISGETLIGTFIHCVYYNNYDDICQSIITIDIYMKKLRERKLKQLL